MKSNRFSQGKKNEWRPKEGSVKTIDGTIFIHHTISPILTDENEECRIHGRSRVIKEWVRDTTLHSLHSTQSLVYSNQGENRTEDVRGKEGKTQWKDGHSKPLNWIVSGWNSPCPVMIPFYDSILAFPFSIIPRQTSIISEDHFQYGHHVSKSSYILHSCQLSYLSRQFIILYLALPQ